MFPRPPKFPNKQDIEDLIVIVFLAGFVIGWQLNFTFIILTHSIRIKM